jgi:lactoylglutathione lyase
MIHARDLSEVHLTVRDLDVAIGFYRDIVGLTLAHVTSSRQAAFFLDRLRPQSDAWALAAGPAPQAVTVHTAFRVSCADALGAPSLLRNAGITRLDFDGRSTDLLVVLAWMPAAAVYFRDPDGNLLEYIAMLPHEPQPDRQLRPALGRKQTWRIDSALPITHRGGNWPHSCTSPFVMTPAADRVSTTSCGRSSLTSTSVVADSAPRI